jgi:asparagine synthase (glutamine-hydrolysing)
MCGIVGMLDLNGRRDVSRELLSRINEAQHHRGPDECGLHVEPGVGLGHRRLSIIDVSTGQQPLYNEDGSVVIVYNGEIYNYQELIPELTALGHRFRTKSDTEVIVHAWEAWGERCVERFRGMFAFALWDRNRKTLFLARDRLGVKPLHYALLADGTFLFGSEIKALLAHPAFVRDIDPHAVEEYFALGYVAEPRTIFKAAHKLPPAHTLCVRQGAPLPAPVQYWDPRFTLNRVITLPDAVAELTARLDESSDPVNTCSIAFADPAYDESRYAQQVADRYRTRHFVDRVESDDYDLIDTLARVYDEPYADSSAIPTYRVCQLARKHVTVALSGDGGDENFGGYRRYRLHMMEERMRRLMPLSLRRPVFGMLAGAYPKADWAPRMFRAKSTFEALGRDPVEAYCHGVSILRDGMRRRLFTDGFRRELGGYSALEVFRRHAKSAQTEDPLALAQYLDLKTYLVGDINTKVDRASMAHSLEVREPLMDHPLVEWLATLPSSFKVRGQEGKWLLKKALEPRLPAEILYRPKMGFAVPLARWFRGPLRTRVRDALLGERLGDTGMFDRSYLQELLDHHQSGRRDYSSSLWTLVMFDAFLRNVADTTAAPQLAARAA